MPKDPKNDRRGEYNSTRWRRIRALHLQQHPLCARCEAAGRAVPAEVVHHVTEHRGDRTVFFVSSPLESLCRECHEKHHGRWQRRWELDADGWLIEGTAPVTRDMRRFLTRLPKKRKKPAPLRQPPLVG
jgi:5-methylcytosine-specific restriction endonuclease McrA